ncbi:hypothetical protein [Amycolatopsis regifaucium]|uniref:Uncharacterized protein n=1 Tax=Amycolatopsis regifaucium TaxID=546365 RepID=A0A154MLZ9_9PSEU|nr:hypothetical protein [Amycolatopsis regifaucium]KZB85003.1 hypothetical protein AVL48_02000 [Amycolatopsis regifaucium]OKA04023.1 hypothetical protein ATP06_0232855 [Amycolatopsis regifaucium]SFH97608.1 hypothetical protein SAMN04489731_107293 [Amycolatopsis regifaucium]
MDNRESVRIGATHRRRFALAAAVFGVSLAFRSADHAVCGNFPAGTHFVWHLLNGLVLCLTADAAMRKAASRQDAAHSQSGS